MESWLQQQKQPLKLICLYNLIPSSYFRCRDSDALFESVSCREYTDAIIPVAFHFAFFCWFQHLKPEIWSLSLNHVRPLPELVAPRPQLHQLCLDEGEQSRTWCRIAIPRAGLSGFADHLNVPAVGVEPHVVSVEQWKAGGVSSAAPWGYAWTPPAVRETEHKSTDPDKLLKVGRGKQAAPVHHS